MSESIPFSGNVFQEVFSVHFVLAPSVPLAIVSPCPLLSSRMEGTTIALSFLSLLASLSVPVTYAPIQPPPRRKQLEREKHLSLILHALQREADDRALPARTGFSSCGFTSSHCSTIP